MNVPSPLLTLNSYLCLITEPKLGIHPWEKIAKLGIQRCRVRISQNGYESRSGGVGRFEVVLRV